MSRAGMIAFDHGVDQVFGEIDRRNPAEIDRIGLARQEKIPGMKNGIIIKMQKERGTIAKISDEAKRENMNIMLIDDAVGSLS